MYNSITHHLYFLLWVHHPKSSLLPSPFIPPYPLLPPPTLPFLSGNHHAVVCVTRVFLFSQSLWWPWDILWEGGKGEEVRMADGEGGGEEQGTNVRVGDCLVTQTIFYMEPRPTHPLEMKFSPLKLVPSCCQNNVWL